MIAVEQADLKCELGCKYANVALDGEELQAGPLGAAVQCLAGFGDALCSGLKPCDGVANLLVSSRRVAYQECGDGVQGEAVVIDYATSPATRTVVPQIAVPESMSGPWLVGLSPGWTKPYEPSGTKRQPPPAALAELNLETGAEPLHIELPETGDEFLGETKYPALSSVQEDGRIVYAVGPQFHAEPIYTASPAEPTPRQVLTADVSTRGREYIPQQHLILTHDLVALEELLPGPGGVNPPARIEVANLSGQRLGGIALRENGVDPFDFNGKQTVAIDTPCVESFIVIWGPGETHPGNLPHGVCPDPQLLLISLGPHGITAKIRCPSSPPLGCADARVRIKYRVQQKATSSETNFENVFPGHTTTLHATLSALALRMLRHHPNVQAKVELESLFNDPTTVHVRIP